LYGETNKDEWQLVVEAMYENIYRMGHLIIIYWLYDAFYDPIYYDDQN